jgi:hypothetical protein
MDIDRISAKPLRALALSAIVLALSGAALRGGPLQDQPLVAGNSRSLRSRRLLRHPSPQRRGRDENGVPVAGSQAQMFPSSSSPVVTDGNGYYDMAAALLVSGQRSATR